MRTFLTVVLALFYIAVLLIIIAIAKALSAVFAVFYLIFMVVIAAKMLNYASDNNEDDQE